MRFDVSAQVNQRICISCVTSLAKTIIEKTLHHHDCKGLCKAIVMTGRLNTGMHVSELLVPVWTPGNPLPECLNLDGQPVWEPPLLNYSALIDIEKSQGYNKRCEAVLLFTGGIVVKTTEIMDIWTENQLLAEYHIWAQEAMRNSSEKQDPVGAFVLLKSGPGIG